MSKIDESQTVFINSDSALGGTSDDFSFKIGLLQGNEFDRVTLLQAGIPKSYYSIQTGDFFTLSENGVEVPVFPSVGNVNRTSLANMVQEKLKDASPNSLIFTIGFPASATEADDGKYTFAVNNGAIECKLIFNGGAESSIYEMLGFENGSTYTFVDGSLRSESVVNLQPFQAIQIHCNLVSNEITSGVNTDVLATIFANVGSAPYSNIQWICPDIEAFSQRVNVHGTGVARFFITDERGTRLNLNNGSIQFSLLFWKKNQSGKLLSNFIKLITNMIKGNLNSSNQVET